MPINSRGVHTTEIARQCLERPASPEQRRVLR